MSFIIVRTVEKGRPQLCVAPSNWEDEGSLKWPKKGADRLVKDHNSTPKTDWLTINNCLVKRRNLVTYAAAEAELRAMLDNTDTEQEDERPILPPVEKRANLNDLAEQLMLSKPSGTEVECENVSEDQTYYIVPDIQNQALIATDSNSDVLNKLLENQSVLCDITSQILENQKKIMHKLACMSVQIDEASSAKADDSLHVTTLNTASSYERAAFRVKQINCLKDLEDMEEMLSDEECKLKLMESCSILCNGGIGTGKNSAYRLIDVLFSRDFLCKCSWSGGTRQDGVKISIKCFKNVLNFFFKLVNYWDNTFTLEATEQFFRDITKNANKRKNVKYNRISTKRSRTTKQTKKQNTNIVTNTNANSGSTEISPPDNAENDENVHVIHNETVNDSEEGSLC